MAGGVENVIGELIYLQPPYIFYSAGVTTAFHRERLQSAVMDMRYTSTPTIAS